MALSTIPSTQELFNTYSDDKRRKEGKKGKKKKKEMWGGE
jgi:hypothetical protein